MSHNITVEGGKTVRLKTAGKYCDRDIVVTATGGGGGSGSGDADAIIDRTVTEISSNAEAVGEYAFRGCLNLKSVNLPFAKRISTYAFSGCPSLADIIANNVTALDTYVFNGCTKLPEIRFPECITLGASAVRGCTGLIQAHFPMIDNVPAYAFYGDTNLEIADMGMAASIAGNAFSNCNKLKALVLRYDGVCSLVNITPFVSCYWLSGTVNATHNPNGDKGYVYVPRAYVFDYPSATNWSSLGFQFRALEDYTVDSTTTGELDPDKI